MKKLLSFILCSLVLSSSLMGLDALNELDYKANIKKATKGNGTIARNATITVSQEDKVIATATSFWNLAQYPGKATYVLKDADKKVVAIAKAYLKEGQPYTLNFDLQDVHGSTLGTMIVSYDPELVESCKVTIPVRAMLFSKEGVPLVEDQKLRWSFYRHLDVYIPGTSDKMSDIECDSLFWTNKWNLKIADPSLCCPDEYVA